MSFDPYITPWKTAFPETGYPDTWPGWTTPDIFVDNTGSRVETTSTAPSASPADPFQYWLNVNQPGEPEIGVADNRLFVVVTNNGSVSGSTEVTVGFTPYAMVGGAWTPFQFEQIAQFSVTLGPSGSPTGQLQTEVQWDLSDITDTNGGLWPFPLGAFSHLCVQVQLTPGNGTQNNFGNVISASPFPIVPLLVVNSDPEPRTYEIVAQHLPEKWSLRLRGTEKRRKDKDAASTKREERMVSRDEKVKITLEAGEERLLTFAIVQPEGRLKEKQLVTLGLMADGKLVGGITLNAGPGPIPRPRPTRPACPGPILPQRPLPVFFPKKQVVFRAPIQMAIPGTTLVRIAEQNK
ncbi:MAG: hypothetical protein ABSB82_06750 [Terriglobia bacterium]|jgi:hypothetical protein